MATSTDTETDCSRGSRFTLTVLHLHPHCTRVSVCSPSVLQQEMLLPVDETVVLREARVGDEPALLALLKQSFLALVDDYGEATRPVFTARFSDMTKVTPDVTDLPAHYGPKHERTLYVAEARKALGEGADVAAGAVVACVSIGRRNSQEGELTRMAVHEALRGRGIGALLLGVVRSYAVEHGYLRVVLGTGNTGAARFYARHGYRTVYGDSSEKEVEGVKLYVDALHRDM